MAELTELTGLSHNGVDRVKNKVNNTDDKVDRIKIKLFTTQILAVSTKKAVLYIPKYGLIDCQNPWKVHAEVHRPDRIGVAD